MGYIVPVNYRPHQQIYCPNRPGSVLEPAGAFAEPLGSTGI